MQETDLMAVVARKSRDMVARYAGSTRAERAIAARADRRILPKCLGCGAEWIDAYRHWARPR